MRKTDETRHDRASAFSRRARWLGNLDQSVRQFIMNDFMSINLNGITARPLILVVRQLNTQHQKSSRQTPFHTVPQ